MNDTSLIFTRMDTKGGRVGIIITTKDRKDDLSETLDRLVALNLSHIPIYILDDASSGEAIDFDRAAQFTHIMVMRNQKNRGLVVNRNKLAHIATEEVLVSLDDDSCFDTTPDLEALADYFVADSALCGVEFDNVENGRRLSDTADGDIVQMYTGFGHAVHRARFLACGGYREFLVHMCEERDFGQRAFKLGLHVKKYALIRVIHRRTQVSRLHGRNAYFLARNTLFLNVANFGMLRAPLVPFMVVYMIFAWAPTRRWKSLTVKAARDALALLIQHRRDLSPLSITEGRRFRALPLR